MRFGGPISFGWLSDDFGESGAVEAFCVALADVAGFDFTAP